MTGLTVYLAFLIWRVDALENTVGEGEISIFFLSVTNFSTFWQTDFIFRATLNLSSSKLGSQISSNDRRVISLPIQIKISQTENECHDSFSSSDHGPYSPTVLKNVLSLFLQDFVNLNVTQLLIGWTVWFSQSEVMLHSNAAKYRKIWRTRLRMFLRMVGEHRPWSDSPF